MAADYLKSLALPFSTRVSISKALVLELAAVNPIQSRCECRITNRNGTATVIIRHAPYEMIFAIVEVLAF